MYQSPATKLPSRNDRWEPTPPGIPMLSNDEVHVWQAGLDEERSTALEIFLSDEERARAGRFLSRRAGKEFIVARGLLRIILAKYLNKHPGQLDF